MRIKQQSITTQLVQRRLLSAAPQQSHRLLKYPANGLLGPRFETEVLRHGLSLTISLGEDTMDDP